MNLQTVQIDILLNIFKYLSPKEILKCEYICKRWLYILDQYGSLVWKQKMIQDLSERQGFNPTWARYWFSLFKDSENESWKTIYRLWSAWDDLKLIYQSRPKLISAEEIVNEREIPLLWKLKLGELEHGKVTCRITSAITSEKERICYTRGSSELFELEQLYKDNFMSINPVRFRWQPDHTHISLEKSTRSDLQVLLEHCEHSLDRVIRIWDPKILPQGPYLPFADGELEIQGLWVLRGNISFVALCNKTCVILVDDQVFVLELGTEKTCSVDFGSSKVALRWKYTFDETYIKSSIAINEGLLGIVCTADQQYVELYHIENGALFSQFPITLNQSPGHESVQIHFTLSRFHAIVYDCDQLVVYDLLCVKDRQLLQCSNTRIPYVGRNIRLELSDDGAFFLVSPTIHHGEVVLVDVLKHSSTSYLLQKCYYGSRLMKGCWLVFQDRKHQATTAATKVIWSPIYT